MKQTIISLLVLGVGLLKKLLIFFIPCINLLGLCFPFEILMPDVFFRRALQD